MRKTVAAEKMAEMMTEKMAARIMFLIMMRRRVVI